MSLNLHIGFKYFLPDIQQQISQIIKKIRVTILTQGGLKAMEELAKLEEERGNPAYGGSGGKERIASNEMCTFLILNISSLQLIPVNMIAYRQQYGSVNPAGIIAPAIAATFVSTAAAVVYCKVKDRRRRVWGSPLFANMKIKMRKFFMYEGIVHLRRMRYNSIGKRGIVGITAFRRRGNI